MNWRILIVDDESAARERLERILLEFDPQSIILQARDGLEALDTLRERDIDFLFLDVEMPELSGIDVLHMVPHHNFDVVFQTAFSQYATVAFELAATDYLLKPYTRERVEHCWKRLLERARNKANQQRNIKEELVQTKHYLENIVIRMPGRIKVVSVADISHFTPGDKGSMLWADSLSFNCDQSLAELEASLDPAVYMRIHKGAIINLKRLTKVSTERPVTVQLSDGSTLRVAREREKKLHDWLRGLKDS